MATTNYNTDNTVTKPGEEPTGYVQQASNLATSAVNTISSALGYGTDATTGSGAGITNDSTTAYRNQQPHHGGVGDLPGSAGAADVLRLPEERANPDPLSNTVTSTNIGANNPAYDDASTTQQMYNNRDTSTAYPQSGSGVVGSTGTGLTGATGTRDATGFTGATDLGSNAYTRQQPGQEHGVPSRGTDATSAPYGATNSGLDNTHTSRSGLDNNTTGNDIQRNPTTSITDRAARDAAGLAGASALGHEGRHNTTSSATRDAAGFTGASDLATDAYTRRQPGQEHGVPSTDNNATSAPTGTDTYSRHGVDQKNPTTSITDRAARDAAELAGASALGHEGRHNTTGSTTRDAAGFTGASDLPTDAYTRRQPGQEHGVPSTDNNATSAPTDTNTSSRHGVDQKNPTTSITDRAARDAAELAGASALGHEGRHNTTGTTTRDAAGFTGATDHPAGEYTRRQVGQEHGVPSTDNTMTSAPTGPTSRHGVDQEDPSKSITDRAARDTAALAGATTVGRDTNRNTTGTTTDTTDTNTGATYPDRHGMTAGSMGHVTQHGHSGGHTGSNHDVDHGLGAPHREGLSSTTDNSRDRTVGSNDPAHSTSGTAASGYNDSTRSHGMTGANEDDAHGSGHTGKVSAKDKIMGTAKIVTGKLTGNKDKVEEGKEMKSPN